MTRKTITMTAMLIGMLFAIPGAALAEESSTQGGVDASVTLETGGQGGTATSGNKVKPTPTLYKMDGSVNSTVKGPGTIPLRAVMKDGRTASGTKALPKGMELRDRMMASGTKPIPPDIGERMERRDGERLRMMGSGTPMRRDDCSKASSSSNCAFGHKRGEHRGEMLKHAAEVVFHRIEAAIKRFNKIAERIDSRITKQQAQGTDTSAAESSVAAARAKTKEAQEALDSAKALVVSARVNADATTTLSIDAGNPVREQLEKAKQALEDAAKNLSDAVQALKSMRNKGEDIHSGTSSPKLPGMMRTRDHMSTGTPDGHTDGAL